MQKPSKKVTEIVPPDGWMMPEGKGKEGDEIELVDTWRMKKGKLCLVEFDGHRMPGYDEESEDDTGGEQDKRGYSQAAGDAMEADQNDNRSNPAMTDSYA